MDFGEAFGTKGGKVLVRMEKERSGRNPRTKYFLSIYPSDGVEKENEATAVTSEQELKGGLKVPLPVTRGSIDYIKPYLPSPGDVRGMFGSDKINGSPENTMSVNPDCSPERRQEVERRITIWKNAMNEAEKDFEHFVTLYPKVTESTAEILANNTPSLQLGHAEFINSNVKDPIEGDSPQAFIESGTHNEIDCGILITSINRKKNKNKNRRVVIVDPSYSDVVEDKHDNIHGNTTKCNPDLNDSKYNKNATFDNVVKCKPKNSRKSYEIAVTIVQKMNQKHWKIVDNLYTTLKLKQCISFVHLGEQVTKIVKDIYGIKSYRNIMTTIDKDYGSCVIKLSKLLLNLYQEANIENQRRGNKFISLYNRNPKPKKIMSTKIKPVDYNKIIEPSRKPPRCEACYKQPLQYSNIKGQPKSNKVRPLCHSKKRMLRNEKPTNILQKHVNLKNTVKKVISTSETNINANIAYNKQAEKELPENVAQSRKDRPSSSPADLDSARTTETTLYQTNISNISKDYYKNQTVINTQEQDKLQMQTDIELLNLENSLFNLLSQSDESTSLVEAMKASYDPKEYSKEYFNATLNLLWLNEKLENNPQNTDIIDDDLVTDYDDCDSSSVDGSIGMAQGYYWEEEYFEKQPRDDFDLHKHPLSERLLSITNECKKNRCYISIFVSAMFGLAAAYFTKDQDFSKERQTLKKIVKVYLKSFLMGALRLVNDF